MNKKISLGVAVAIVIAFVTATFAITMSVSQRIYNRLISNLQDRAASYALIDEMDAVVRENYYGKVSDSSRDEGMLEGYVDSLNDSSSYYLSPSAYATYQASMKGEINGIGINSTFDFNSGYIKVTSVLEGSTAYNAGIKENDLISVIDGEAVTQDNYLELTESLNGNKLTSVKITYVRDNTAKTVSVMMGYSAKSVYSKNVGSNTVYIRIDGFYANTAQQLKEVLEALPDEVDSLVFDLRSTKEGSIQYTCDALKLIVPIASEGSGALATEIDKNGKETYYASNSQCISGYKIAVLTNGATEGCGELFACDLRDFGMAVLIGTKTAGNANVQKAFSLSDGSGIILTVGKMKPYITETFERVGLEPDILVEYAETKDSDTQIEKALEYLG
ncbi:MAG: PDZ domain-containing protein [Clostridia bacterium]|nr:PDZ domain-containing protein [Clostridia bacterium]